VAELAALALATFVSEDLACIAAGALVASGQLGFAPAALACFAGILAGDLLLYGAGRALGRPALLRRLASDAALARASRGLARRGPIAIALSRFVPGARLPTYLAAGALGMRFAAFAGWLSLAAALWTPFLVGVAAVWTEGARALVSGSLAIALAGAVALLALIRIALSLTTWRGRRLWLGRWRRMTRWEFWPLWLFYLPIAAHVARLAVRHRSLRLATAVNPGIAGGGFAGERKSRILAGFRGRRDLLLASELIPAASPPELRLARARAFLRDAGLSHPVVVKPDVGERGSGVVIARSDAELARALAAAPGDVLVQEHAAGLELGVFYVRHPDEPRGRIVSITEKRLIHVTGDGWSSLERLILEDERAVCSADRFLARFADRLDEVPDEGERIPLVEVGTHSRGALFLDGWRHWTPALEADLDELSRSLPGFHFGRYDVRLTATGLKVLELNGLTAEATHVYDPKYRVFDAWRTMFGQWRLAFEIAAANRRLGARPASWRELTALMRDRRNARPSSETMPA
jgi:membrane protein DedA with SNARE-associated domain